MTAVAILAVPLAISTPAAAPLDIRLHVDASLRTNAVYHLACLGESISCSRDIFARFWATRLGETAGDSEMVAAWRQILARVIAAAPEMPSAPILINAVPMNPDALVRRQVIAALIEARSAPALRRLAPGVHPRRGAGVDWNGGPRGASPRTLVAR